MTDLHGMTLPTCDICVNGQKRKLYGKKKNKVYLHNGDNFQLKIFNPLQERIGVQLNINGQKVDNDLLVMSPGQEITIERYIGTNRKLTFSSYDIDTSNMSQERYDSAVKAIEKNGLLEIIFWNEKLQPKIYSTTTTVPQWTPMYPYCGYPGIPISGSTLTVTGNASFTNATDVVINGNLKINGTLDINNGQLVVSNTSIDTGGSNMRISGTSGTSGSSGSSGTSGTSGKSGAFGTRGVSGNGGTSGTSGTDGGAYGPKGPSGIRGSLGKYSRPGIYASDANLSYNSLGNMNGMGNVVAPVSSTASGAYSNNWQNFSSDWGVEPPEKEIPKKIETGRIEKGSVSTQNFTPIAFEVGDIFYKIKFKLLPYSLKPVKKKLYDSTTIKNIIDGNTYMKNESAIREYCKCGYRISRGKGLWDFCPRCGRKIKK